MGTDKNSDLQSTLQEVTKRTEKTLDQISVSSVTSCKNGSMLRNPPSVFIRAIRGKNPWF
jgi:hypothetical protein